MLSLANTSFDPLVTGILDAVSATAAILDGEGTIVAVNRAWQEFGAANGLSLPAAAIGRKYLDFCHVAGPATVVADTVSAILNGEDRACRVEYDCHGPDEKRWFVARVSSIGGVPGMKVLVLHDNVTPLRLVQQDLRRANATLARLLKRRRALSPQELQRVEAACRTPRQKLIVSTLIDLGLRVSELTGLSFSGLDEDVPSVLVSRTSAGGHVRTRRLPLTSRAAALWREALASGGVPDLSTRQVQRIVRSVGRNAGLPSPLSPQDLRETFAVRLVENGAAPELLNYAMGYRHASMTDAEAFSALVRLLRA